MENKKILKVFSLGAFIIMIFGIIFGLLINRMDLIIRGIWIVIPATIAILILYKYNLSFDFSAIIKRPFPTNLLFYFVYIITILLLYLYPYRSLSYFLFITIAFLILSIEIIFGKKGYPTLLKIVLLFLNISFGATLKYPFFYGSTDSLGHYYYTQITLITGQIIPTSLEQGYHYFPLYHIYLAIGNLFSNLNGISSYFIFNTIPFSFTIIFLYLLFKKLIKNDRIVLLICLIYAVTPVIVLYSHYVVTRVFAFNAFIILFYLLYKYPDKYFGLNSFIITTIINIYIILVHPTSIIFIFIILGLMILLNRIHKNINYSKAIIINLALITAFYYLFITYPYTGSLIISRLNPTLFQDIIIKSTITPETTLIWIRNNFQTSIFLFYLTISLIYLTANSRKNVNINIMILFSIITLIFYVPNPLQTIWQAMTLFRLDRIALLISPMMSFTMALGFILVTYNVLRNKQKHLLVISLILITSFAFFSMTTSDNAPDCVELNSEDNWDPRTGKQYYDAEEINSLNYIVDYSQNDTRIYSVYKYNRYFDFRGNFPDANKFGVKTFDTRTLREDVSIVFPRNSLILPDDANYQFLNNLQRIYDNYEMQIYR